MNYNYIRFSGIAAVLKSPVQNCTVGIAVIFTPALAGGTGRAPALSCCAITQMSACWTSCSGSFVSVLSLCTSFSVIGMDWRQL